MSTVDQIPLANANAFQLSEDGKKGDWIIRENATDRELARLNGRISDEDVFAILHFAREYELLAFNAGIDFQKAHLNAAADRQIKGLLSERQAMIQRNEELANALERAHTRGAN